MLIYLDDYRKSVLKTLLDISDKTDRKRLHFKKNELSEVFNMEYDLTDDIIYELQGDGVNIGNILLDANGANKLAKFVNDKQIDIIIYKNMIEEQLNKNEGYVRKYKDWCDAPQNNQQ